MPRPNEKGRIPGSSSIRAIPCEVYSRVVGYYRPVQNWNKGKQEEFKDRAMIALVSPQREEDPGCSLS